MWPGDFASIKAEVQLQFWYQFAFATVTEIKMERIILLTCCFGVGISMDNTTVTEGPLREVLHGPVLGTAPTSVQDAVVVIPGSDASHFRKLAGEVFKERQKSAYKVT